MYYIKRITLLMACFSLLFTIVTINKTYAKYKTDISGESNINVARWRILVNNQDIRNNSDTKAIITPTLMENENIKEGVIAPTSVGYFDIIIDCSAADVSFSYEIGTAVNATSSVNDIVVTGYSIDDGEVIEIDNDSVISNNVYNRDNVNTISLRVYIKWDDSDTASMNNEADTAATKAENSLAKLDVSLSFKQIA